MALSVKRRVVITGAAGRIGVRLRAHFGQSPNYELVLIDKDNRGDVEIHTASLSRYMPEWTDLLAGADAVIHLAGDPRPSASWLSVADNNIETTLNLFSAAAAHRVRRVVYASSLQTMEGYRYTHGSIAADAPPRPTSFYAASKLMGEAVGRQFARERGLSVICLRIGSMEEGHLPPARNWTTWGCSKWLSAADLCQAVEKAILTEDIGFAILPLTSDNAAMRWDLSETCRVLGYKPTMFAAAPSPRLLIRVRSMLQFVHRRFINPAWRHCRD